MTSILTNEFKKCDIIRIRNNYLVIKTMIIITNSFCSFASYFCITSISKLNVCFSLKTTRNNMCCLFEWFIYWILQIQRILLLQQQLRNNCQLSLNNQIVHILISLLDIAASYKVFQIRRLKLKLIALLKMSLLWV